MVIADRTVARTRAKGTGRTGRGDPAGRGLAGFGAWLILASMALATAGADGRISASNGGQPMAGQAASSPTTPHSGGRGALVICGGGGLPEPVRAGVPQAGRRSEGEGRGDPDGERRCGRVGRRSRRVPGALDQAGRGLGDPAPHAFARRADEPAFARVLDEATGVWFGGGDQSRVTEVYLGTAVERALNGVLDRGGVIGGTSAGAAIMSRVMITGGQARATVGTGFGFLPGAVVDQHALRRNRINRLLGVLAEHPDLTGVAVNEATALVVHQGRWRVMGNSYVAICRPSGGGQPLRVDVFHDGDAGSLEDWKPRPSPAASPR